MTDITASGSIVINSDLVEGAPAFQIIGSDNTLFNQIGGIIRGLNQPGIRLAGARNRVVNEAGGRIEGTGAHAIQGSESQDIVENAGALIGTVNLGGGNDTFVQDGGSYSAQIDLGTGDDTYILRNAQAFFTYAPIAGGDGYDTIRLENPLSPSFIFSGFERLQVRPLLRNENFHLSLQNSELQQVEIVGPVGDYAFAQVYEANLPNANLSIAGLPFSLASSTVKSITGSDAAEGVELSGNVTISSGINLGGGDDSLSIWMGQNPATISAPYIDGGAGTDSITFTSVGDARVDLANYVNFERLNVGVNFATTAEHRLAHIPDLQTFFVSGGFLAEGPIRVVIEATDRPNLAVQATSSSEVTISSDSRVRTVFDPVADPQQPFVATSQNVIVYGSIAGGLDLRGESDVVRNGGRIEGSVLLGDGADRYTELSPGAVVLGTVEGGAGGDRFDLLTGHGGNAPVFNGGDGADLVSFSAAASAITLRLGENLAVDGVQTLSLISFQNGAGSAFGDTLIGSADVNRLEGLGGADRIEGLGGDDLIFGGLGNDSLDGGAGNDSLDGGDGADQLLGGIGDDFLAGAGGDDLLDGGTGLDRASYGEFWRSYAKSGAGLSVTLTGSHGADSFTNVEQIAFADGTLVVDPDSAGAKVIRLYDTILGRTPDSGGLDFYVDRMEDRAVPLTAVASELAASSEFRQATGGLNNGQFVDHVYQHALHRAADAGGKAYYTARLDSGAIGRGDFVVDLSESSEHRALTAEIVAKGYFNTDDSYQSVALLYDSFLGRLADVAGLAFYGDRVKNGVMSIGQVAADFAGSHEFTTATAAMTNEQLVDYVYANTLERAPDAGGRAFYLDRLDHGTSKAAFVQELALSQEHYYLVANIIVDGIQLG